MKKKYLKIVSVILCAAMVSGLAPCAFAQENRVSYTITDPYADVEYLLPDPDAHYRTNLHTHSTVSDATTDYADMIKGYYDNGFDILGFADHGVIGKYWNEEPTHVPLYAYQYIAGRKVTKLTDDEYAAITGGTYPVGEGAARTQSRGMQCVPTGIELNMLTLTKSHVNGYFCDFGTADIGFENGHEYAVRNVDKAGGLSVINHPGDWLGSGGHPEKARDPENVRYFGEIFNKYSSCLGMEVLQRVDSVTASDRILWDEVLQYVIPRGERTVWGFGNSDAHKLSDIDTMFMDFILPEFTVDNFKDAMIGGNFFAVGRRAHNELGGDFVGTGAYPTVAGLTVDDENDTITVTAKDTDKIQWIANGNIILESAEKTPDGFTVSTIRLAEHSGDITCYVRFQLLGSGGICLSQPFTCDDGDMARFIIEDDRTPLEKFIDRLLQILKSARIYIAFQELYRAIF